MRLSSWVWVVMFALCGNIAWGQNPAGGTEREQRLAPLNGARVGFDAYLFSGEKFPAPQVTLPETPEHSIVKLETKTTFYDRAGNVTDTPDVPGRYGAVVELRTPQGESVRKYITLFRQKSKIAHWCETSMQGQIAFPPEIGIRPEVARAGAKYLSDSLRNELFESMIRKPQTAVLLAGLYETKPGEKQIERNSPYERDRHYWFALRRKLGEVPVYPSVTALPKHYAEEPGKKFPLLVFLHGSGERGTELPRVRVNGPLREIDAGRELPFVVLAPQCPDNEDWFCEEVRATLEEACQKYRIDRSRIYLTGLSMGGYGTWETALAYPDLFAAIAPMCAGGDPLDAARLRHLPIWNFHGEKDELVSFHESEEMVNAVRNAGGNVKFTLYPDLDHICWTVSYMNPDLYLWFLAHSQK